MRTNYFIATWAGPKRRNPSTEYLIVHLTNLFSLKHSIDQVTVIRPKGSDNEDFYNLPTEISERVHILNRPENDRSYGQFIYAAKEYPDFDYYILAEDDYIPVLDNFDTILRETIEEKKADYLCGRYHRQSECDPLHPEMNIGIVKSGAMKVISSVPVSFPVNGTDDGIEKIIFANLFTDNGLTIADYSDRFAIPYWDRYLRYLTDNKGQAMFVPYQLLTGRAFTYKWDTRESIPDLDSHFLVGIDFNGENVLINNEQVGVYRKESDSILTLIVDRKYEWQICERLRYINRDREILIILKNT